MLVLTDGLYLSALENEFMGLTAVPEKTHPGYRIKNRQSGVRIKAGDQFRARCSVSGEELHGMDQWSQHTWSSGWTLPSNCISS